MNVPVKNRPLTAAYYWAGKGSARVHALKGFNYGVDHEAYDRAYDQEQLEWLHREFGTSLVFLSYNWGLPPELECEDWRGFSLAAVHAHGSGMEVAAYIQASNAVSTGSYENRDWYAVTPRGKRIPYYNGRFFTCLNHPEWRETVLDNVRGALAAGADAIFLDNCAFGGMPVPLARDFTAFAGCYCERCRAQFLEWQRVRGLPLKGIPRLFRPGRDPNAREYAHWRAWVLTTFLREIKATITAARPGAKLMTNTFGAVNLNTYNIFGVDLPEIAKIVDMLFVENLQSPRANQSLLVQNAGTFKLLQSLKPDAPALSISYERGIGVDAVPSRRSFARTAAEAFASGGHPVLRACEYIEDNRWTLLEPGRHDGHASAWRSIVDFVERNPEVFEGGESASPIAVFVPPGLAWRGDAFPENGADYLGTIQALVGASIPFRIISEVKAIEGVRLVLIPEGVDRRLFPRLLVMRYSDLGVNKRRRSLFDLLGGPLEPIVRRVGPRVIDAYYSRVHVRRLADRLDLLFRLVFRDQFAVLRIHPGMLSFLESLLPVSVSADCPVYADLWKNEHGTHLHLVNYGPRPVNVRICGDLGEQARLVTPRSAGEAENVITLDTYAVLSLPRAPVAPIEGALVERGLR